MNIYNIIPNDNGFFATPPPFQTDMHCVPCRRAFGDGKELLDHLFQKHMSGKQLMCMKCEATENLPSAMETHLVRQHKIARRMCPICGQRVVDMGYHRKTHLPVDAQIHCKVCGKRFASNNNLKSHMNIHSGEKPFECNVCSGPFSTSVSLAKHMQRAHPNQING